MANRAVRQPNGLYARFSDIVDDFTHMNLTRAELWEVYCDDLGRDAADGKMARADQHLGRFDEAINEIKAIHGRERAQTRRDEAMEDFSEAAQARWKGGKGKA